MNDLVMSLIRSIPHCNENCSTTYPSRDIEAKKKKKYVKHEIYMFQENEKKNHIEKVFKNVGYQTFCYLYTVL